MNDRPKFDEDKADLQRKTGSDPIPPAGPHDKPELTNPDATPGAGSLPSGKSGGDTDGGTG